MATYGCALLMYGIPDTVYYFLTPPETKWRLVTIVFVFSFMFPVLNIFLLYRLKRVSSFILSDRRDRTFPYILTAVFYFGLAYLLMDVKVWPSMKVFLVGAGISIMLTALINFRTKISAHMVGIGGVLGVLIAASYLIKQDLTFYYLPVLLAAGLVGTSRLILKEHNPAQIYSGFILGCCVQLLLFFSFQSLIFA